MAPPDQENKSAKRHKKAIEDDLICPITHELPFDPVMAMDGRVYEKKAIKTYFSGLRGKKVKSPMTSEMMHRTLLPASQHRNIIEASIESGVIKGYLATKWNQKVEEKEAMETLIKKAKEGDAESMFLLGLNYSFGEDGFEEDQKRAFEWYEKANVAGHCTATAKVGEHLVRGLGTDIDPTMGGFCLGFAAGKGSCFAAYLLGKASANGDFGFKKNVQKAKPFLEMATSSDASNDLGESDFKIAQQLLDDLKKKNASY